MRKVFSSVLPSCTESFTTDGRQRPLGIASLEDKIVQQAVVTVLNTIHEEDFLGFSYGFRPGRSQHDALDALTVALKSQKVTGYLMQISRRSLMRSTMNGCCCFWGTGLQTGACSGLSVNDFKRVLWRMAVGWLRPRGGPKAQ
jgi:hypothetical protein